MDCYLKVDRLGCTMKKLMIEQIEQPIKSNFIIWFKKEDKLLIEKYQMIFEPYQFLRYSSIEEQLGKIDDLISYKDKYGEFKEVGIFKSNEQPKIIPVSSNNWIIVHATKKLKHLYYFTIDQEGKTKLDLYGKYNEKAVICKDKYLELFYIIRESKQKLTINVYHINDHLKKIERLKQSQYEIDLNLNKSIDYITLYNDNILLIFTKNSGIILYQNTGTYQQITLQKQKKLYFYSQFLYTETVLLMIETDQNELILFRNKLEVFRQLNIDFKIFLNKILELNLEHIKKLFLLDLIQELPNIKEFCLWNQNDFEVVKLLIVGLQSTEEATLAIIHCLKYYSVHVIGIIKYLEYYCFLIEQEFKIIINAIFELIPGYLMSDTQQNITKYPKYIDYLKQYNITLNDSVFDSEYVWHLLCTITDNQHLQFK